MEFCPKCDKVLTATKKGDKTVIACPVCGYEKKDVKKSYVTKEKSHEEADIVVNEEPSKTMPKTSADCPECGNKEAYYEIEQTRSADEAPTRIYKCTKCGHKWREYS